MAATTFKELREEVKDNLERDNKGGTAPNSATLIRALNRAKDQVVAIVESIDPLRFLKRLDYSVTAGDAYIDLPGYGEQSEETPWRRLLGLYEVPGGSDEIKITIYDRRQDAIHESPSGQWVYREGDKLYFNNVNGANAGATLRLRYSVYVADSDGTDLDSSYSYLPPEWTTLVVTLATRNLLSSKNQAYARYDKDFNDLVNLYRTNWKQQISDGPMRVRLANDYYG